MYNTFFRKTKSKLISKILSNIGYTILQIGYFFYRNVLKSKRNYRHYSKNEICGIRNDLEKISYKHSIIKEKINKITDENVDLSIVVPAYNVEKYVLDCLNTILNQKTQYNYEIIVVNDGSTDDTDLIIKKIQSPKLKYVTQENQGLSGARNTGINEAVGRYIMFVDSDDLLEENAIESMMKSLEKNDADIVIGSYYMFSENQDNRQYCINKERIIANKPKDAVNNHGYAWGKIFKRELFNNVRFPMGMWYEDTIVCNVLFRMNCKVVVIKDVVYGYRINSDGISRTARASEKAIDHYWAMEDAIKQANENGIENDEVLYELALGHMSTLLYRRISLLNDEVMKETFVLAADLINCIRPKGYITTGRTIKRDIEKSFITYNYKLWKVASFII
jgi:glycosyltransferase involved in cell wall biosynthesis